MSNSRLHIHGLFLPSVCIKLITDLLQDVAFRGTCIVASPAAGRFRPSVSVHKASLNLFEWNRVDYFLFMHWSLQISLTFLDCLAKSQVEKALGLVHMLVNSFIQVVYRHLCNRGLIEAWISLFGKVTELECLAKEV